MKMIKQTSQELFILFLVKLGFNNASVSKKIIKARKIIGMMTGNDHFLTPSPSMQILTDSTDALEAAEAAMDGSKIKTDQRNTALETFTANFKQEQSYVELVAKGNVEVILSSGFELRNPATKPVQLPAPIITKGGSTGYEGQFKISWKAVKGKKLYVIEMTDDPNNGKWELIGQSTKANITLGDLKSGELRYFRVAAINSAGLSPWSDIVSGRPN